jgi:hypothetical protein
MRPCGSVKSVFDAVARGDSAYGVVAMESSSSGLIPEVSFFPFVSCTRLFPTSSPQAYLTQPFACDFDDYRFFYCRFVGISGAAAYGQGSPDLRRFQPSG